MVVYQPANTAEFDDVRVYRFSGFAFAIQGLTPVQLLDSAQKTLLGYTDPAGVEFQIPNQTDANDRVMKLQFRAKGVAVINNSVLGGFPSVPAKITAYGVDSITLDGSSIAKGLKAEQDEIYTDQPVRNVSIPTLNAFFQLEPGAIFQPAVLMPAAANNLISIFLWLTAYSIRRGTKQWP